MPAPEPPRRRGDPLAVLVLAAVLALAAGGYYAFPSLLRAVQRVDCLAAGRVTGC